MPECQKCGAHLTEQYARVCTPENLDNPRVCPRWEGTTCGREGVRETQL